MATTLSKDNVQRHIAQQVLLFPQEKLYVHTDKPRYVTGERLWFRSYLVDAVLHVPSPRETYVQVELINPGDSVVGRVRVSRTDGAFSGSLDLPTTLPGGDYVLRAYTGLDHSLAGDSQPDHEGRQAFFHRKITLLSPVSQGQGSTATAAGEGQAQHAPARTYAVSFYPEGGYLVAGVPNRVAFKALHADGSAAVISGRLMDGDGRDHGAVETLHAGMGRFELSPAVGKEYFVVVDEAQGSRKEFVLPSAVRGAHSLQVFQQDGELEVSVLRAPGSGSGVPLYLLLHTRGMVHYMEAWDDEYEGIAFDTGDFPSGVVQILLLDGSANPLSERLVFCRNADDAQLAFSTDKSAYSRRSPVKASVRLTDHQGVPLSGSFSVSVTDDYDVSPDRDQDILATILLGSELRGHIPDPAFYLMEGNEAALDILLMTHGWRRYDIPEVIRQRYAVVPALEHQGLTINGRVTSGRSERSVGGTKVSIFSWQTAYTDETMTDSLGRFAFGGLEFADSLNFVVQTDATRGLNNLTLHIEQESFPAVSGIAVAYQPDQRQDPVSRTAQEEVQVANVIERSMKQTAWEDPGAISIEEVKIDAPRDATAGQSYSYFMPKERRSVLTFEQLEEIRPMSLSDALKHFPDVRMDGNKIVIERMFRNSLSGAYAAIIIDDILIHNTEGIDDIVDPLNIESIGVLKGAGSVLLGSRGAGGAIVITTRKGMAPDRMQQYQQENIRTVSPLGLQVPVEFYAPVYETAEQRNQATADLRSTIYWNPEIKVSASGEAGFDFYTADMDSAYTVVIEGITDKGLLIRQVSRIVRK